jgi:ribosomal protein L20A (L18A)
MVHKEAVEKSERGNREHIARFERSFDGVMAGITKAHKHRGPHELAASLVQHLHDRLDRHRSRHGYTKSAKEQPMDTLHSIMKDGGIAGTCAAIVAKGTTTITQDEIVEAVSKVAHERYPELSSAQAFAKVYSDQGAEGRVLRSAINVAKASLAETMLGPGLPVTVVGNQAAQDVDNATEAEAARAELMRIGRKQWPRSSKNEIFERAFSDPRNATIVARLYQRPTPTSIYPMPNEWLAGDGSQDTKADRSEATAYDELMRKAEEYRSAHPELSEAQAFEKVFTAPANRELAKRERIESAPG